MPNQFRRRAIADGMENWLAHKYIEAAELSNSSLRQKIYLDLLQEVRVCFTNGLLPWEKFK